jgi:hypothetical protein
MTMFDPQYRAEDHHGMRVSADGLLGNTVSGTGDAFLLFGFTIDGCRTWPHAAREYMRELQAATPEARRVAAAKYPKGDKP